ncbi:MAG: hypothetical protein PSV46_18575 [Reyranella sp.]|nr:hypothetical protein [Reyranella sp.]
MRWPLSLLAGVALLVPLPGSAEAAGPLLRVLDGDTYEILIEGFPTRVRLANADTPETGPREKCAEELAWATAPPASCASRCLSRVAAKMPSTIASKLIYLSAGLTTKLPRAPPHLRRTQPVPLPKAAL